MSHSFNHNADMDDRSGEASADIQLRGPWTSVPRAAIEAALPNWFPQESRSELSTPLEALRPLISALARALSRVRSRRSSVPSSLRPFVGMRERSLVTGASSRRLFSLLWQQRDARFVRDVCHEWLSREQTVLPEWTPEGLSAGYGFPDLLGAARTDQSRLSTLASVLWVLEVDRQPGVAWAFDLVCSLLSSDSGMDGSKSSPVTLTRAADRRGREAMQVTVNELMTELKTTKSRLRDARRESRRLTEQLKIVNEERERLALDAAQYAPTLATLREDLEVTKQARDAQRRAYGGASSQLAAERRHSQLLQERLDELRKEVQVAEEQRLVLSTRLNDTLLRMRQLEGRMQSQRSPEEQVMAYLDAERRRLDGDLLRLQGGDAAEAARQKALLKKVRTAYLDYRPQFTAPRPPPTRPRRPLHFLALGGADEIGASAYVVELAGHRVLIDCGIRVGRGLGDLLPALDRLGGGVDAVILTHAHTDHCGGCPALVRRLRDHDDYEIFATPETAKLVPIMLKDSRKHYERLLAQDQAERRYMPGREVHQEAYDRQDMEEVYRRLRPVRPEQPVALRGDLCFTLFPAGHILGAASVLIEGGGRRVFLSGDFSDFWQLTVAENRWPRDPGPVDLLVLESTYGDKPTHADRTVECDNLFSEVEAVVANGGSALIPCFALGRAQEVLRILATRMADRNVQFPVWIDGMVQDVNEVYRHFDQLTLPSWFHEVRAGGWTREEVLDRIHGEPCAVVSTSGMLAGGPMVEYAAALLPDGRNRILFCGYQDEYSPGKTLQRLSGQTAADRVVHVPRDDGTKIKIRAAAPASTFNLSAHADSRGLLAAAELLRPAHTVLVHGDGDAESALAAQLTSAGHEVHHSSFEFSLDL